ncbi:MAG: ribosome maturation factor RimM [Fimbriimonadales bacterium]
MASDDWVSIGQIVGAFGLKGQVKVKPLTDFPSRFEPGTRLRIDGEWYEVEKVTWNNDRPLVKLDRVKKREQAEALQWKYLEVPASSLPELEEDEFLVEDLLGMKVISTDGNELGVVDDILNMPAQDILVVGKLMIPVVKEFVKDIDLDGETIKVELIPGMLET